jgi:hypothetical protein
MKPYFVRLLISKGGNVSEEKVAIFVDTENLLPWIQSGGPERLLKEISSLGQAIVRRAYGKWTNHHLTPYQGELNRLGFELIHNYHPVSGKNSSDIQMTVDIMEYAWRVKEIYWFVLATGDSDFSPLFRRLRELGKEVVGVGPHSALSESVKSSCSRFIYTEITNLKDKESLRSAFDDAADLVESVLRTFDGPANCANLKEKIRNVDSAFDEKSLGYSSFTTFLKAIDSVKVTYNSEKTSYFASLAFDESSEARSTNLIDIPIADTEEQFSIEEIYRRILRQKDWRISPKQNLITIFEIIKPLPLLSRNEIIDKVIEQVEGDITATDIRKVLSLFFKGKLIDISTRESDDVKLWKLKDVGEEELFEAIDEAMLSRLLSGGREQGVDVDVDAITSLLMGNYQSTSIQKKSSKYLKKSSKVMKLTWSIKEQGHTLHKA